MKKVVYLTFDDGPSENTKKIMDILAKYDAKATFFVTGRNQDYNYLIKDAYNAGHTIALHTYSHEYSTVYASVDAYFDDLNKVGQMVKKKSVLYHIIFVSQVEVQIQYQEDIVKELCQLLQKKLLKKDINIMIGMEIQQMLQEIM